MEMVKNEFSTIDIKGKAFNLIMEIYKLALNQVFSNIEELKRDNQELISNISRRVKKPDSILKKMKKKNYKINCSNLIDNIDDIAGVRIVCPLKEDIFTIIDYIRRIPNINILKEKDYVTKAKKSGYSAYHLIVETPVVVMDKTVLVKVEIQIRTMAMDFWATNEHDVRYKTSKKLSFFDSKRLYFYAKIINLLDDKMMKIVQKQR